MSSFPQGTKPRLIQVALAEVGTAETGNNETKYGKFMKADKLPWCGSFLNWCADQAGVKVPNVVSTRAGAEAFQKRKQWHTTPKIGDFVTLDLPEGLKISTKTPIKQKIKFIPGQPYGQVTWQIKLEEEGMKKVTISRSNGVTLSKEIRVR